MHNHSNLENLDLTQLLEFINALTKAFTEFTVSQDHHHQSFLNSFQSLQTQTQHHSHPPLPSDNSNAHAISLTPIFPFKPVTVYTIQAQELHRQQNPMGSGPVNVVDSNHEEDGLTTPVAKPMAERVLSSIVAVTQLELHQKGLVNKLGEKQHRTMLALPWMRASGDGFTRTTASTPPSPWFTGELGQGFYLLVERQIVTTALAAKSSVVSFPDMGIVSFDPGGTLPDVYHSAECRLLHLRKSQKLPSPMALSSPSSHCVAIPVPSSPFPSRASLSSELPSSPVQFRTSPAKVSFQATTALSQGPASSWPWVPWRNGILNGLRVSIGLFESVGFVALGLVTTWTYLLMGKRVVIYNIWLEEGCSIGFITELGPIITWVMLLLKRNWAYPLFDLEDKISLKGLAMIQDWAQQKKTEMAHLKKSIAQLGSILLIGPIGGTNKEICIYEIF